MRRFTNPMVLALAFALALVSRAGAGTINGTAKDVNSKAILLPDTLTVVVTYSDGSTYVPGKLNYGVGPSGPSSYSFTIFASTLTDKSVTIAFTHTGTGKTVTLMGIASDAPLNTINIEFPDATTGKALESNLEARIDRLIKELQKISAELKNAKGGEKKKSPEVKK